VRGDSTLIRCLPLASLSHRYLHSQDEFVESLMGLLTVIGVEAVNGYIMHLANPWSRITHVAYWLMQGTGIDGLSVPE
jgi:hypothetical protein